MEQAEQEGCLLEWDSGPSVTVQSVQVVTGRQVPVSETSRGLVEVQTSILGQTLVMAACDTHTHKATLTATFRQQKHGHKHGAQVQFIIRSSLLHSTTHHTTTVLRPFFRDYPGEPVPEEKRLDFMVQGKINRGRHTNHPAGCHSIQTNQCPSPPSPSFFYRPDALPAAQPTVSKHCKIISL